MKNVFFVFLALLIMISTESMGQGKFAIGIKAGPNLANLDAKGVEANYQNRTGWHAGALMLVKFGKIGIQPEVIFSKQGPKASFNSQDLKSNFNYFNIPVILKLYTVAGINLQVGPQFGFLSNDPEAVIDGQTVKGVYKSSDVSLGMGVGWDLPFGLSIDARYNLGLSKIEDDSALEATKNQVFQFSLGFKIIDIGK